MKLRLTDEDRARYGGDEWLEWDPDRLTCSEAEQLQELLGVKFAAYPGFLKDGIAAAIRWALWLSLRRTGVEVKWDDFDPDLMGVLATREGPPGKDRPSTPTTPSGSGESTTPPP